MTRNLDALTGRTFDVLVIGGGITGACIAHDAALRGLTVALVEKNDFGHATSSASSKLLHGGIRYLQQGQVGKVRESALERTAFIRIAPHLVRWVPFLIPATASLSKGRLLLGTGIRAYHAVCVGASAGIGDPSLQVPRDYFLDRGELLARHPVLESLGPVTGAWVIHEAHMRSSERMTLAFVKSAAARGAVVANYAAVTRLLRDVGGVTGVEVRDELSGRLLHVAGRVVINAAGPWISALNATAGGARLERDITAFSKGIHVVTPALMANAAVALPTRHRHEAIVQRGGRHLFIIPWRGRSLIGTSNVPFRQAPDDVSVTREDVESFVQDVNEALPAARLSPSDVQYAFAGLYPLTEDVVRPDVYQGTGFYQLVDHAQSEGIGGYVSVLGAKYTTARRLAERTVDLVARKLRRSLPPCQTRHMPLVGGAITDVVAFTRQAAARYGGDVDDAALEHLVGTYGTELDQVLAGAQPAELVPLTSNQPTLEVEATHAVRHEMAQRLDDIVFRRTGLGTIGHPGQAALCRCAQIMSTALGWDEGRTADEIRAVERRFDWNSR